MARPLAESLANLRGGNYEQAKRVEQLIPAGPGKENLKNQALQIELGEKLARPGVPVEDESAYQAALEVVHADDEVGKFDVEAAGVKQSPAPGAFGFSAEQIALANAANESFGQSVEEAPKSLTQQFGEPSAINLSFGNKGLHYAAKPKQVASSGSNVRVIKDRPDQPDSNNAEVYS